MAEVFISYASKDRERVRALVKVLEAEGCSVWWDRQIDVGVSFDKAIEIAVDEARCIVVVWSANSIQSDWVRAEAAEGLERDILVPVLIDDVRPPLLFRQKQACRLLDLPNFPDDDIHRLITSVKSACAVSPTATETSNQPSVSVLLADIQNETARSLYSGSLDEALRVRLEAVMGIYLYPREQAIQLAGGASLDIDAATQIGAREGLDFVIGGRVFDSDDSERIEIEVCPMVNAENVSRFTAEVAGEQSVSHAIADLLGSIQGALLERDANHRYLAEEVTVLNLGALRAYNTAQRLAAEERFEESLEFYRQAVEFDPDMGRAHGGWAVAAHGLGRNDEARDQWRSALRNLDRMTELERLRTTGVYYAVVSLNYAKSAEIFRKLLQFSPVDTRALNNLAVVCFSMLDFEAALDAGRRALEVFPDSVLYRGNYALYAMYASDFKTAQREAQTALETNPDYVLAQVTLAITALVRGDASKASELYHAMKLVDLRGLALANAGLADLAMAKDEWPVAIGLLEAAIEADRSNGNIRGESTKTLMLAECTYAVDDIAATRNHLDTLSSMTLDPARLATLASLFVKVGDIAAANQVADDLNSRLSKIERAYGLVVKAQCFIAGKKFGDAVDELRQAIALADIWDARRLLGEILIASRHEFEGIEELDLCLRRSGEAVAMYLDDVPTFRYVKRVQILRDGAMSAL
ncbi:MAG: tetratricopeptide (TPR) repeat protein [Candidatus Azotimanducaceae bacterium]|jgi:tetratricopeptide (TPR) repeat protein